MKGARVLRPLRAAGPLAWVALLVLVVTSVAFVHALGTSGPPARPRPLLVLGGSTTAPLPSVDAPALPSATLGPTAAATGSTPSATTTGTTTAPAVAAPRPAPQPSTADAAAPVVLGTVGTFTGPAAVLGPPAVRQALQAWVTHVNAGGGVGGHPVRLIAADDQGDPSTHLALLNQLLAQGVVAFVGLSGDESDDGQVLSGRGVPVIGALSWSATTLGGYPDFAPSGTSPDALTYGALVEAAAQGAHKLAVFWCQENQGICGRERNLIVSAGYAADAGLTVVYDQKQSLASSSYTTTCRAMKSAGADTVFVSADGSSVSRLRSSCESAKISLRYVVGQLVDSGTSPGLPDGTLAVASTLPWALTSGAPAAERSSALRAAHVALDSASVQGWAAAKLTEHLIAAAVRAQGTRSGPVTSAALRAAAAQLRGETLGGLVPPLTGAVRAPAPPTRCWFFLTVRRGAWTAPRGAATRCGAKP